MSSASARPKPSDPKGRPKGVGRAASWVLAGPLSWALGAGYVVMLAAWVPQYLSWPWWTDLDHFSTFAMAWDAGVLPYRDLPSFQLPGEYYLFWAVGKVFGWGRTAPVYAADAAALGALGLAMAAWSRARFGRALPGVVGYGWFLCYYLNLGLHQVAQRDWHSAFLATLGLFAVEVVPGRRGRLASGLAMAAALAIRPHVVLLTPAFLLALDASARPAGAPWGLTRRAVLEWGAMVGTGFALAFVPLVLAGTLGDFARGLGEAAPGGSYNKLTPATLVTRVGEQVVGRWLPLAVAGAAGLASVWVPERRRAVLTWLAAFAGAWWYKPLSPVAHPYLIHTMTLAASVLAALLVVMILEFPGWSPSFRLGAVVLLLYAEASTWPRYVSVWRSARALTAEKSVEFPRMPPDCGPMYDFYTWDEYRATVFYLRRTVPPDYRIANALRGLSALTAPVSRLPAFPEVSLSWFEARISRPGLEEGYIRSLKRTPRSVVVWRPGEEKSLDSFVPRKLVAYIRSAYTPEARLGTIEVWRRRAGAD